MLRDFLRPADRAFFCRTDAIRAVSSRGACGGLVARFGDKSVFMDESAIQPGQEFPQEIREAILGCRAMLVIIGPYWLAAGEAASGTRRLDDPADWVRQEVEAGLARPEAAVIPVLTDGAKMPNKSHLPRP